METGVGYPPARAAASWSAAGRLGASPGLLDVLVGLLEHGDPYFRAGSSFVRMVAVAIGRELELTDDQLDTIGTAALLRDLGRIAMHGQLIEPFLATPSDNERFRIEQHVVSSLELLAPAQLPEEVVQTIRHHHESWNGTGYPDGLAGKQIPLLARILNVADAMGAMLSPRPYRPPKRPLDAFRELRSGAGTVYDPSVVNALGAVLQNVDPAELGFLLHGHLLLVHPDSARAATLAVHLGTFGFLVDVANDLATAQERLLRVPFRGALIAADTHSGPGGPAGPAQLIRTLRGDPRFQTMPILAVDATSPAVRLALIQAGFDGCISRDTPADEIVAMLHAFLRRTAVLRRYLDPASDEETGALLLLAGSPVEEVATQPALSLYALQGNLNDFPLVWLLQAMQYDRRTALVHLHEGAAEGLIAMEAGEIRHARLDSIEGEAALDLLLDWKAGSFRVQHDARCSRHTVRTPLTHLILEHARLQDEARPIFGTVS